MCVRWFFFFCWGGGGGGEMRRCGCVCVVWRVWVDVHWVERLVRGGCWDVAQR
eukprot:COSAG03_NODE_4478_length_1539_cov_12.654167_4_plen_52_part_01